MAWGSVHWQYLEDMSKVTAYEGTPLKLTKTLYTRQYTKKGPVLEPVQGPVKVGDELVVRIVLRTDRDMEFVHLKDHRGSRHRAGQRALALQVPGRPGLLRDDPRHGQPLLHRLPAQGHVCLRVCHARRASRPVPDGLCRDPVHVRPGVQQPHESIWIEAK